MIEQKPTILYVDDEEYNLSTFKGIFRRDFRILTAASGVEAIETLKKLAETSESVDLIITDQRMPEMTGIEFLKTVIPQFPDPLRMILTGFSDVEAIIAAINTGQVFRYITKPWDEKELKMTLDRAIQFRTLQRKNAELVKHLSEYNERLEREVEQRTSELEASNQDLKSANKEIRRQIEKLNEQSKAIQEKNELLEQLNNELNSANLLKNEFLGIAAHDLKSPLSAISGFAELCMEKLEESPIDKATLSEYIHRISSNSVRMTQLISDLLETTAIESKELKLNLANQSVSDLVATIVEQNIQKAKRKNQSLKVIALPNLITLVDRERLTNVIENLISNAIKFSPIGTTITVSVGKSGDFIQVQVKDHGQGLTDEDMTRVFGKFQRLSARPTGDETSTGLGLAIVKMLVELHGGSVRVESEGKDKGSNFIIELPIRS